MSHSMINEQEKNTKFITSFGGNLGILPIKKMPKVARVETKLESL